MRRSLALTAAGLLALTACGGEDSSGDGGADSADSVTVFAAASLNDVFEEIAEHYTEETGVETEFNIAGSSGLVEQLENGAPADVLATADEENMEAAVGSGLVDGEPELFTENHLVVVTPAGNPAGVSSLEDLGDDAAETVVCAEQVPCGAATQRITEAAGIEIAPVSEETSVTDVLGRVRTGEADAGLVYTTDALQAGEEVETIEIEGAEDDPNLYPIALLEDADAAEAGQDFIDFVLEDDRAQEILTDAGFAELQ